MWQAKTEGGMAPVERALVLAALAIVAGFVVRDGVARLEAVSVVVLAFLVGFGSGLPRLLRLAATVAVTLVGAYVQAAALGGQGDVGARSILSDAVPWTILLLGLPLIDPPAGLRRWSRARVWPWPIYFAVSAILVSALVGACLLISIVLKERQVPHALAAVSFLGLVATPVYMAYRQPPRRIWRPAILVLRPAGAPPHQVLQQISKALEAKVLLVVLDLESLDRGLPRAAGRWGKLAFLRLEQIFLAVAAVVVIGLLLAPFVAGHRQAGEPRHLHALIVVVIATVGWIGRLFIKNWRVGRAVDRVGSTRIKHPLWPARRILKAQMSQRDWRAAVERLGEECDCLLIDLSTEVDRLSWEIDHLKTKWMGRAAVLLTEAAAIPAALKATSVPVVRYSPALQAWQGFAAQLRQTVPVLLAGPTGGAKEFVR